MAPKSGKERSKAWRDRVKNNPDAYEDYLKKERERYSRRKEIGSRKLVADMTGREHRRQRAAWRRQQASHRAGEKRANLATMTPPSTPPPGPSNDDHRRQRGRKAVRKDRAKAYRTINKLTVKLAAAKRAAKRLQKRNERLHKNITQKSPLSKARRRIKKLRIKDTFIRKQLEFNSAVVADLSKKHNECRKNRDKQIMAKVFSNGFLKKYRLLSKASKTFGLSKKAQKNSRNRGTRLSEYDRKTTAQKLNDTVVKCISDFFERDDISTQAPGKRDTITRGGVKKQKRYLADTIANTHKKFLSEHPMQMSYSTFCRYRPFWVVARQSSDWDTCRCRRHENISLKSERLHSIGALNSPDPELIMLQLCCDITRKSCMYRECKTCDGNRVDFNEVDINAETHWFEWQTTNVEKLNKNGETEMKRNVAKNMVFGTVGRLMESFEKEINDRFCKHTYNIRNQYREIRKLRKGLTEEDAIIHIDFSENYSCKHNSEIQSMHFGGSRQQTSLHTGMIYLKRDNNIAFSSVSDCTRHDPAAIWAHLKPVLNFLKETQPQVKKIHFISDGPTTQYRQKHNFYLLSSLPFDWGFQYINWTFLEAGHGKGAADGVGAVLKRTADRVVLQGKDLPDAQAVFNCLQTHDLSVKLFYVTTEDVAAMDAVIPQGLKPVPGTMQFHQIIALSKHSIHTRVLSCFSCSRPLCECFDPVAHKFPTSQPDEPQQIRGVAVDRFPDIPMTIEYDNNLIGQWCIVVYDNKPYPGEIEDADEEAVLVSVLHKIGRNRFFSPPVKDIIWYTYDNILCIIPKPSAVTKRHVEVEPVVWERVLSYLNI